MTERGTLQDQFTCALSIALLMMTPPPSPPVPSQGHWLLDSEDKTFPSRSLGIRSGSRHKARCSPKVRCWALGAAREKVLTVSVKMAMHRETEPALWPRVKSSGA